MLHLRGMGPGWVLGNTSTPRWGHTHITTNNRTRREQLTPYSSAPDVILILVYSTVNPHPTDHQLTFRWEHVLEIRRLVRSLLLDTNCSAPALVELVDKVYHTQKEELSKHHLLGIGQLPKPPSYDESQIEQEFFVSEPPPGYDVPSAAGPLPRCSNNVENGYPQDMASLWERQIRNPYRRRGRGRASILMGRVQPNPRVGRDSATTRGADSASEWSD